MMGQLTRPACLLGRFVASVPPPSYIAEHRQCLRRVGVASAAIKDGLSSSSYVRLSLATPCRALLDDVSGPRASSLRVSREVAAPRMIEKDGRRFGGDAGEWPALGRVPLADVSVTIATTGAVRAL